MTWIRLTDTVAERPIWEDLGSDAFALHVAALGYSNRQQTSGRITRSAVRRICWIEDPMSVVADLCDAGAWVEDEGGYLVVWDLGDQLSVDEVGRMRQMQAERAKRSRMHKRGDHSLCSADYCRGARELAGQGPSRDESRDASRHESRSSARVPSPTQPDPSQPSPPGLGLGLGGGDDPAHGSAAPGDAPRKKCPHGLPVAADGSACLECMDSELRATLRVIAGGESA